MIENIIVSNFKSLKHIDLFLANLNLLAGLNGMGKSSLIQVVLLLNQSTHLNLSNGELTLNGEWVQIGKGKDALYEFASEEKIDITLKLFGYEKQFHWTFLYKPASDKFGTGSYNADMQPLYRNFDYLQYISADRLGPQAIYDTSISAISIKKLGIKGEYAAHYLHVYGNREKIDLLLKHPKTEDLTLLNQVNGWLNEISPGIKLSVTEVPHIDKLLLNYQFELGTGRTAAYKPQNVGFGLSYVLPVILALLTSHKGQSIIIENPESHVHPRGQAELGKLMALAAENGAQLFIETHSDHIINGIRVAVKENLIAGDKVNIAYFDKATTTDEQYTRITSLKVDDQGEISEYPKDFLDEWNNQLLRLI